MKTIETFLDSEDPIVEKFNSVLTTYASMVQHMRDALPKNGPIEDFQEGMLRQSAGIYVGAAAPAAGFVSAAFVHSIKGGLPMVNGSHRFLSSVWVGAVLVCILWAGFATADDEPVMPEGVSVLCDLGSLKGWNINRLADCDSLELYEFPQGSGNFVGRFLITPADKLISNGRRAEVRDPHVAVNLDRVWYRFSTIIPLDFPMSMTHSVVTAQWHEKQFAGRPAQRPPVAHRLVNGEFRVELWNDDIFSQENKDKDGLIVYREPDYALGKVHEFIYRIDWRPDASGAVTGWKRECDLLACEGVEWTRFVDYQGAIGYKEVRGYYFKMGIYTVHEFSEPMSVIHADYGRGATAESIGLDSSWNDR